MPVEIERKFLVISDAWRDTAGPGERLEQAYVAQEDHASVRVRLSEDRAWLTLKSARSGIIRDEFEYEVSLTDARDMLARLCPGPIIEKTRYRVPYAGQVWEVDVFAGSAAGLVMAEVELASPDERLDLPAWVGREVTDDPRFRNSALALDLSVLA